MTVHLLCAVKCLRMGDNRPGLYSPRQKGQVDPCRSLTLSSSLLRRMGCLPTSQSAVKAELTC